MTIITKDRYFGEGISSYGAEDPKAAYDQHRTHLRRQRLNDLLGAKADSVELNTLINRFEEITAAIKAADQQAYSDNVKFVEDHDITA